MTLSLHQGMVVMSSQITHTHTHTHTHTYLYTHIHIHTHTRTRMLTHTVVEPVLLFIQPHHVTTSHHSPVNIGGG